MSPDAEGGDEHRYRFGPLERRGLVAGWRGGQIAALSAGLVVGVLVLRVEPTLVGVVVALLVVAVAVAASTWPVAGRTVEEWAPDAVRHAAVLAGRRVRRPPPLFGTLRVLAVAGHDGQHGPAVVHDAAARTFTAVMPATARGFALAGEEDKAGRVSSWSAVLSGLARQGSAVRRIQWVARSVPDDGRAVRGYLVRAAVADAGSAAHRSYTALLDAESAGARSHEVLVALSLGGGRGRRDLVGSCRQVVHEMAALRRQLIGAGIETREPLDAGALSRAVRRATSVSPLPDEAGPARGGWPWPMGIEEHWDRLRAEDAWHVTYWIAEWPRRDVGSDFLGPLLVADVRRTVSLVMEPVSALEATRRVEQARTADIADAELRRRGGFLATARRRREEEVLAQRELELADGHAHFRFCGYVTVTAADGAELDDACARTEQAAARAGLELRRCYGAQARAYTCTLPLGRGLP
ncbi:MAG: SCO6880 family protein [Acidimicrobiales bacterium]